MACSPQQAVEILIKVSLISGTAPGMAKRLITASTGKLSHAVPNFMQTTGNLMIGEWLKLDSAPTGAYTIATP